jgi:hypothetical protein
MTEIMRATRASIPIPRPQPSSTTSSRGRVETKSGLPAVGLVGGESGAIETRNGNRLPEVARAFDLPAQAATLARSLERVLAWGETSRFSGDQFEGTMITGVAVREGADPQYVSQCLAKLEGICQPCDRREAAVKLAELRVLTVHRARDGNDMELMAQAYTDRLAEYPRDVVTAATKAWADREEFWPSWAELKAECDKRMRGRLQIRDALRRFR